MDDEAKQDVIGTREEEVAKSFDFLLLQLEAYKPNDRSKRDRYWAIVNTEVEKAKAVFVTYCKGNEYAA